MAEKVTAGPITSANGVREAVCIHTKKIFSSCKDKDCIEDLTFYPTATAQSVIDASQSIRGGRVELLHVGVDVEPVSFNRGFFTVDMRFLLPRDPAGGEQRDARNGDRGPCDLR